MWVQSLGRLALRVDDTRETGRLLLPVSPLYRCRRRSRGARDSRGGERRTVVLPEVQSEVEGGDALPGVRLLTPTAATCGGEMSDNNRTLLANFADFMKGSVAPAERG